MVGAERTQFSTGVQLCYFKNIIKLIKLLILKESVIIALSKIIFGKKKKKKDNI